VSQSSKNLLDAFETVSIVVAGQFKVDAFEPSNLHEIGSIDSAELERCKVGFRLPEQFVISFPTLSMHAQSGQLALSSTVEEPVFERVLDFFMSFFGASKVHLPAALGINTDFHCRVAELEKWHAIGHRLVPKDFWKDDLKLKAPGLLSVYMESARDDDESGVIRVRAEPSGLLTPGLYVQVNDHFNLKMGSAIDDAMRIVGTRWRDCRRKHSELITRIRASGSA
jgi:hypothetical protein